MGALYPGVSISGYNSNPPPDDGTTVPTNQLQWNRDIKGKIGDPIDTAVTSMNTALLAAFGKTISGGSVVKTATNYGASAADQGRNIVATASSITITTPDATSVLSPFVFAVNNQSTGTIAIAGANPVSGQQNVDGIASQTLGAGRGIILWTDGSNWFTSGFTMGNLPTVNPPFGFDAPLNLQLNATVGSNLLTIAVKAATTGNDPTAGSPVLIPFRDNTVANGDPVWVAVTSALSINTNATGASLGTVNSIPFRIWVLAFNNAGTAVLALFQAVSFSGSSPTAIAPLNEATIQSTTGLGAAATSAGVFYTPNGTTLSNKSFRIIGYIDYVSGVPTAGSYSSAPTIVQLFGPGVKKPGDVMQSVLANNSSSTANNTSSFVATSSTISITPTSNCNIIAVSAFGYIINSIDGNQSETQLSRGSSNNTNMIGNISGATAATASTGGGFANFAWDQPQTTSAQTYALQERGVNGTATLAFTQTMQCQEFQA